MCISSLTLQGDNYVFKKKKLSQNIGSVKEIWAQFVRHVMELQDYRLYLVKNTLKHFEKKYWKMQNDVDRQIWGTKLSEQKFTSSKL